jgi:hypothetical protein
MVRLYGEFARATKAVEGYRSPRRFAAIGAMLRSGVCNQFLNVSIDRAERLVKFAHGFRSGLPEFSREACEGARRPPSFFLPKESIAESRLAIAEVQGAAPNDLRGGRSGANEQTYGC